MCNHVSSEFVTFFTESEEPRGFTCVVTGHAAYRVSNEKRYLKGLLVVNVVCPVKWFSIGSKPKHYL